MMNKRDLKADLELCNKATQGPWRHEWNPDCSEVYAPGVDKPIILVGHDPYDADFVVQAREGWPHALRGLQQKPSCLDVLGRVIQLSKGLEVDLIGARSQRVAERADRGMNREILFRGKRNEGCG